MERVAEGNEPDQRARASFADEPLHGLYCRRRWVRVTYRHDGIRDALWTALKRIPGVQATLEPRVTTPLGPGDQRRADIKVHLDGTTWLVDVGVGTQRLLAMGTAQTGRHREGPGGQARGAMGSPTRWSGSKGTRWRRSLWRSTRPISRWGMWVVL